MALAASHSWRLPPLMMSVSDPSLQRPGASSKRRANKPPPKRYTFTTDQAADAGPLPPSLALASQSDIFNTPAGSRALDIELRLREYINKDKIHVPSRTRTHMLLEVLQDLSNMPSTFSGFMPLLVQELRSVIIAPGENGPSEGVFEDSDPRDRMRFYFEGVAQLREDAMERRLEMRELQHELDQAYTARAEGEAECDCMRQRVQEIEAVLKARLDLDKKHEVAMARAQREYALLEDERHAIEVRCGAEEVKCRLKDEKIKEVQVELFVEQKRTHEQTQLYKELRSKKHQEAQDAAHELRRVHRALLRSHQAYLRQANKKGDVFELNQLSADDQIYEAMMWAGRELDAVQAEEGGALHFEEELESVSSRPESQGGPRPMDRARSSSSSKDLIPGSMERSRSISSKDVRAPVPE